MKSLLKPFIIILILGVALLTGKHIGDLIAKNKMKMKRQEINSGIIAQLQTLDIGDTLPDHVFEDLDGNTVRLYDLLNQRTVLIVALQSCESCHDQIAVLSNLVKNTDYAKYFIIVSWDNPRIWKDVQSELKLKCPFLYDHRAKYFSQFDITTSPFNITLNKNAVVLDMLSGTLLKEEFEEIIEFNRTNSIAEN